MVLAPFDDAACFFFGAHGGAGGGCSLRIHSGVPSSFQRLLGGVMEGCARIGGTNGGLEVLAPCAGDGRRKMRHADYLIRIAA